MPLMLRFVLAAVLVASAAGTANAHERRAQSVPGDGRPPGRMSAAEIHELFDAMLVMQAQNRLSLDEEQYARFVTRLKVLQDTRRRNQQERARLIAELQRLSNPRNADRVPESELKLRLNALHELEARAAAELRRAYDDIDEVLSPLQQARFRVLEEQIERRKLELVSRARQNRARPNGQRQPQRPPPKH